MLDAQATLARARQLRSDDRVAEGVDQLRAGAIVAFPTETVFALAVDGVREDAVERLYQCKGRPANKPMPMLVADTVMAERVAAVHARARAVMAKLWPGPITLVLPATSAVPAIVRAGGDTVGVRCPAHPLALAIVQVFDGPLAAPSANRSGEAPATSAAQVQASMLDSGILILNDEPPEPAGRSSTVVFVGERAGEDRILRAGPVLLEQVAAAARCS